MRRMHRIGSGLPAGDGVAVFNRVYLSVTRELQRRLATGWFTDPAGAEELGARFAGRYLDAVEASRRGSRTPSCWRPLFHFRRHPSVHALQFATAGINAHIGHDLPLALLETCEARGCEPDALESDFERIGDLLTGLEERIREELMPGPDLLDVADPLTHLVGSWSLEMARSGAWAAFRALWGLRGLPELAADFAQRLDESVGMAGRCLLTPLPPLPRCGRRDRAERAR
ncbi:DUF5995 family protein [Streptomyces sp. WMMB 714]|uniref:DUF5995 family protein n=1 Tax=Streptomyces sp. WMMB 714 TaxID=1286822 RepID=UPI0026715653|nr:DUF5995 family protein [Streptomyces sp. WMMB 714]